MKKWKSFLIFIVILITLLILTGVFLGTLGRKSEVEADLHVNEELTISNEEEALSPEETVLSFAEILYTYDTRERPFYEGADVYMTDEAYEQLIPMPDQNESDEIVVQMVSQLQEITCYYRQTDDGMDVLADVWYTLNGTGEYPIRQILKLSLVQKPGWKVSSCTVLDTMEQ